MRQYLRALAMGKHQWPRFVLGLLGMLIDSLTVLGVPLLLRLAIDAMSAAGPNAMSRLGQLAWYSLGLGLFRAFGIWLEVYMQEGLGNRIGTDIRRAMFQKLLRLPFSFFDRTKTGDTMSRLTKDVDAVRDGTGFVLLILVVNIVQLAGTLIAMFLLDATLSLVILAALPLILVVAYFYSRAVGPLYDQVEVRSGSLHTVAQENVSGMRVVKAFVRGREEIVKFERENEALLAANVGIAKLNSLMNPCMDFFGVILALLVVGYGGYRAAGGYLSLGSLVAFTGYVQLLYWPLRQTGWLADMLSKALAGAKRIFVLLDADEQPTGTGVRRNAPVRGSLIFDEVYFRYEEDEAYSLSGFSLSVAPGERVAIIGGTGSGKTTVANLAARFYDPSAGRVLLDGMDLREWPLEELRHQIGFVFQDNFLFSLTVRENIALGQPDSTGRKIEAAAADAQIAATIARLPARYETMVGERGIGLSGGERQRIALARALLIDPPILILDDSTASLDARTENAVQEALDAQGAGKTLLIIAQRVATAMRAGRIVVLDGGRIIEEGTHAELLRQGGVYATLYREQMSLLGGEREEADGFAGA